jgi:hypothetical protein
VERIDESCGEKMIFLLTSQCGIRIASFTCKQDEKRGSTEKEGIEEIRLLNLFTASRFNISIFGSFTFYLFLNIYIFDYFIWSSENSFIGGEL